jgi:hypothetical protein
VLLLLVQLGDVRKEHVRRALEKTVIVEGVVVVGLSRRLPVLPVDGACEALEAVLDRRPRFELLEEGAE